MIHVTHVFAEESLVTSHVNNVVNLSCKRMFYPIEQAVRFQGLTVVVFSFCPSITCHHFACRTIESSEVFDKRTRWDPKCLHWHLVYHLITSILDYLDLHFEVHHSVHVHCSFFGGRDATFAKRLRIHESTRASLDHQVVLLRHNW